MWERLKLVFQLLVKKEAILMMSCWQPFRKSTPEVFSDCHSIYSARATLKKQQKKPSKNSSGLDGVSFTILF